MTFTSQPAELDDNQGAHLPVRVTEGGEMAPEADETNQKHKNPKSLFTAAYASATENKH